MQLDVRSTLGSDIGKGRRTNHSKERKKWFAVDTKMVKLLPRFRDSRLCDITGAEVQPFLISKLKSGYAWETTHHLRSLLSKVVGTAVDWNYLSENPVRGAKMPQRSLKRPHRSLP